MPPDCGCISLINYGDPVTLAQAIQDGRVYYHKKKSLMNITNILKNKNIRVLLNRINRYRTT